MPFLTRNQVICDTRPVHRLLVIAHTTGAVTVNTSGNHWTISLVLPQAGGETPTIRADMAAEEYGETQGVLNWSIHNFLTSLSTLRYWDFPVNPGTAVWQMANLIYGLGRDDYDMSGGGSGCRYWVKTVVRDFANWGYIPNDVPHQLDPGLLFLYNKSLPPAPLHMVVGTFYPKLINAVIDRSQAQTIVRFAINDVQKATWLSQWLPYDDQDAQPVLLNPEYNLVIARPQLQQPAGAGRGW